MKQIIDDFLKELNQNKEGSYYGNKKHYLKRHNELKTKIKINENRW